MKYENLINLLNLEVLKCKNKLILLPKHCVQISFNSRAKELKVCVKRDFKSKGLSKFDKANASFYFCEKKFVAFKL